MANHRPKSLSELNSVYDKAMRAERAIKEGSTLLSVPETKETPQSENIFHQLETKAAQAEKNQVFDPDITNIANDFLKRYAQAEKPKATPKEIKRPAPSIQSVYHSAVKPRPEEKQDVPLNIDNGPAIRFEAPSVPLHKPAPTISEAKPEPVVPEVPAETAQSPEEIQTPAVVTTPQTLVTDNQSVASDIPADTSAPAVAQVTPAKPSAPRPVHKAPARVRITSTERNELMEEYLRVMSDDDDDDSYRKPVFSFFKKKKKHEEEFIEEPMADLYEELPEEDEVYEEAPTVPFDDSQVKYTDEYSDAPENDELPVSQEQMNIYDYIEADFDYDDEDSALDVSLVPEANIQEDSEETVNDFADVSEEIVEELSENTPIENAEEISEEPSEEAEEIIELEEESLSLQQEAFELTSEEAEEVVYPETEESEAVCEEAPPSDMVFEDIFSVSDESKRSHTGGNWEEVFGESFASPAEETVVIAEEIKEDDYPEYSDTEAEEEYAQPIEEESDNYESDEEVQEEPAYNKSKGNFILKFIAVFTAVICILGAATTLLISTFLDVNSGNLVSNRYRVFSTPQDLTHVELEADTLVITENIYAHVDDIFVYTNSDGSFDFGKVSANVPSLTGDYLYLTQTDIGNKIINRDNSMGVVVATYAGIGGILAAICQNYILISAVLLIIAIAMIVCLILISKRKSSYEDNSESPESADNSDAEYTDSEVSVTNDEDSEEEYDDDSEYYSDFDTDGIEQGLFSDI